MMNKSDRPVLVSVLLVVFGCLWLFWLHKLHSKQDLTAVQQDALKCHQVAPMLRSTLLVFSIFLACSSIYFIIRLMMCEETNDTGAWCRKIMFAFVFLVIFFIQISYIVHTMKNKQYVKNNCSIQKRLQLYTIGVFAIIQVCVGVYLFMVL